MESCRKMSSSGELFSFPIPPNVLDSDFKFEPSLYKTSPADHLFFNGRLLPHAFPSQPSPTTQTFTTSRTSSTNGKHSSIWSRSNSTSSMSSSCSSGRTSWSDSSERRLVYHSRYNNKASKLVSGQLYGDSYYSHRWQYITSVPVLKREVSRRKNGEADKKQGGHQQKRTVSKGRSMGCFRFLRLFLLACRECHAMEPSRKLDSVA